MAISDFQPVIGLEVHAQLLTRTKVFAPSEAAFGAEPNAHTDPVTLGLPGALPVLNEVAVQMAIKAGVALGCTIREKSVFSRKHYFYPDLPKGYQISQYDLPLCENGTLEIDGDGGKKSVHIIRIHMEEDAGKNTHDTMGRESLVDFNRAGVPLIEVVSAPDLRSSNEASEYFKALRDVLVYLGVNDGNLEEGSLRCDANVSVMRKGATEYGQRCEIKNLNSFRFIRQAIDFEIARQVELIESGGKVKQETRLFDNERGETRSLRSKEDAHDYRYFPEPDLPPLVVTRDAIEATRAALPELPRPKVQRYVEKLGLPEYDAKVLAAERDVAEFFDACAARYPDAKKLSNWFMTELMRVLKETSGGLSALKLSPESFAELLGLVDAGTMNQAAAKEVFAEVVKSGEAPRAVMERKGLAQLNDVSAIEALVDEVIAKNAGEVEKYRGGKVSLLGFFVGQVMRGLKGKGNPAIVNDLMKKKLG